MADSNAAPPRRESAVGTANDPDALEEYKMTHLCLVIETGASAAKGQLISICKPQSEFYVYEISNVWTGRVRLTLALGDLNATWKKPYLKIVNIVQTCRAISGMVGGKPCNVLEDEFLGARYIVPLANYLILTCRLSVSAGLVSCEDLCGRIAALLTSSAPTTCATRVSGSHISDAASVEPSEVPGSASSGFNSTPANPGGPRLVSSSVEPRRANPTSMSQVQEISPGPSVQSVGVSHSAPRAAPNTDVKRLASYVNMTPVKDNIKRFTGPDAQFLIGLCNELVVPVYHTMLGSEASSVDSEAAEVFMTSEAHTALLKVTRDMRYALVFARERFWVVWNTGSVLLFLCAVMPSETPSNVVFRGLDEKNKLTRCYDWSGAIIPTS